MDALLDFITEPPMVLLIAIAVFVGQVVYLARRLKAASRNLRFADTTALEEAQKALSSHRDSLESAKGTIAQNLGRARDELRDYKRPLELSIEDRRVEIQRSMKGYADLREQKAFKDAKKHIHQAVPRTTRHAPKDI